VGRHRVRSQAGTSLADVYDVGGSIAGIEELDSEEVKTVHEMGGTTFSERYGQTVLVLDAGAVAQSTQININVAIGDPITRLLGWFVVTDVAGRLTRLQLSVSSVSAAGVIFQDVPYWVWQSGIGNDVEKLCRILIAGVNLAVNSLQVGEPTGFPQMLTGDNQANRVNQVTMRGDTSAFGAGTVNPRAILLLGAPVAAGGLSSRGLPVPSW